MKGVALHCFLQFGLQSAPEIFIMLANTLKWVLQWGGVSLPPALPAQQRFDYGPRRTAAVYHQLGHYSRGMCSPWCPSQR